VTTQDKMPAIYVRTAVHDVRPSDALAAQEQRCRAYAVAQGWHVGEVFVDEGIAGTRRDRPGVSTLLAAVRDGAIERAVIAGSDRLSRSHADIKAILHEMEARGVACVSMQQPVYAPGPATKPVEE
jgi:DNA invertase Pin-like site-specific DNA recombinase